MVPLERPETNEVVDLNELPEPALKVDVVKKLNKEESVPYSNQEVVSEPLGLTSPFRLADVWPTPEADNVLTKGNPPKPCP